MPPNPPLEAQAEQQRLYESVCQFCLQLCALLLVVEDVHWADGGTLAILRHLARRVRALQAPVLIVLTYREVELDSSRALNDVLHDLSRERLATRIKLAGLSREATGEMLAAIFAEEVPAEFLDGIYRETEGNPFYVEEVCKALVEGGAPKWGARRRGAPQLAPRGWAIGAGPAWMRSRFRRASAWPSRRGCIRFHPPRSDTLRLAAIYGRDFDFAALRAVSDLDEESLIEALETAERARN